tara:strand:- start:2633 stop:3526 length:894 start_codon:yes stop_codon:yes gene_type:complete
MRYLLIIVALIQIMGCSNAEKDFDSQGHRGCRGLLPENTLPGFIKALDLGVNTLELDCVISGDHKVVVSHEPYFNHEISTGPEGLEITKENDKEFNLYTMSYDSIKLFDVGLKLHSRFPTQKKIAIHKPLLSEVVEKSDEHAQKTGRALPFYNIEIKRMKIYDGKYNPAVEQFVELVLNEVKALGIEDRTTIQSFDLKSLQLTHQKNALLSTALLIENRKSPEENITELGYIPSIYSCYFKLLNEESMAYLKSNKISVVPWTVNSEKDIRETIELGVDGIISDYPDRVNNVMAELGM